MKGGKHMKDSHFDRGLWFVQAAAIRRYHAEGLTPSAISKKLGCNAYQVELVLRNDTDARVRRLADEGHSESDIANALQLPRKSVHQMLRRTAIAELRAAGVVAKPADDDRAESDGSS
jgi:hypothetical protein